MSDPGPTSGPAHAPRLPARPSLEQLRKRAKERLVALREADPAATLADAQLALAREYGFASWPKLVHHIESVQASGRLEQFERLANDLLAGYHGDAEALRRLIAHFGVSYSEEQVRVRVRSSVDDARDSAGEPTLTDVRHMLARQYGFESWSALAEGLAQPPDDPAASPLALSATPPFYRIDWKQRTIEPRPPLGDRDWDTVFDVMREHGLTGIATSAITDRAMEKLSRLDFVTSVNVGGAQALGDDGLLHLARMPQLEELELGGWHCPLGDRGLEVLRHLRGLRRFSMGWAQRISDAGVANLVFCDQLESVNIMGTPTGDGAINTLRGKRELRRFKTGKLVTDAGIPLLQDFPAYRTWGDVEVKYDLMSFQGEPNNLMIDGPFTDRGLALLAGLDGLFSLSFFWHSHAFTSEGLKGLAALPNLGFVGCQGARCDDAAMRNIAAIPKLRMLMAQGTVATDAGFEALSASRTLEHLWGRECPNLTGRGFLALSSMPALKGLAVSCKRVDDAALSALPRFPALQFLMPMDVGDDGFRHVGACEGLKSLWCMYCRDTGDEATAHIASLGLELYYAGKTRITDRSLEILSRMTTLESLEFWETAGITDAGVAMLAGLPRLRKISVEGAPRVTRQGMAVFPAGVDVNHGS
ncbi:MAG TPA: hypothetical protein VMM18_12705 [Gemmatimonadaceae bacterium]|nr:hypothetical protein [Gemmatimonadaceae bacterium]